MIELRIFRSFYLSVENFDAPRSTFFYFPVYPYILTFACQKERDTEKHPQEGWKPTYKNAFQGRITNTSLFLAADSHRRQVKPERYTSFIKNGA